MLVATLLALSLVSADAPVEGQRVLVLVRARGTAAERPASFVRQASEAWLVKRPNTVAVGVEDLLANAEAAKAQKAIQGGQGELRAAHDDYDALELDGAVEKITSALAKFERNSAYLDDVAPVVDGLALLGATRILRGEEQLGVQKLASALAMRPDLDPDARTFNPAMRQLFDDTATKQRAELRGQFKIASLPPHGEVYVDGVFAGVAPLDLDAVAPGRHYIKVSREGYRPWGRVIEARSGHEVAETAELEILEKYREFEQLLVRTMEQFREGEPQKSVSDALDELGALLNADSALLVEVAMEGEGVAIHAAAYNLNARELAAAKRTVFAYTAAPEKYAQEVDTLLNATLPQTKRAATGPTTSAAVQGCQGGDCGKLKRNVFIACLAGGGGLALVGGLFDYLAHKNNNDYRETAQVDAKSDDLRSSGERNALIGDVLIAAGVASAVTGTLLYLFWEPETDATKVLSLRPWVAPLEGMGLVWSGSY